MSIGTSPIVLVLLFLLASENEETPTEVAPPAPPVAIEDPYAAARRDFAALGSPENVRYLVARPGTYETELGSTLRFVVVSATRNPDLMTTLPVEISPGCWRIDLIALGWKVGPYERLGEAHPYSPHINPLIIRADWLIRQVTDGREIAYHDLLFQGDRPKTIGEFALALGVQQDRAIALRVDQARVEGESGVAKQRIRRLRFVPSIAGYYARTDDFFEIRRETSPLENLLPDSGADAHEVIGSLYKTWKGGQGVLQAYALGNQKEALVGEAPTAVVEDFTRTVGHAEIVNFRGCVSCHVKGLIAPSENLLQTFLSAGVELEAENAIEAGDIERLYLSSVKKTISRAQEDYSDAIAAITGQEPEEFVDEFRAVLEEYHADVTLDRAAAELGIEATELSAFIAEKSQELQLGAHVSGLAVGIPIPRFVWEDVYLQLEELLKR